MSYMKRHQEMVEAIKEMKATGRYSNAYIARELGCSEAQVRTATSQETHGL